MKILANAEKASLDPGRQATTPVVVRREVVLTLALNVACLVVVGVHLVLPLRAARFAVTAQVVLVAGLAARLVLLRVPRLLPSNPRSLAATAVVLSVLVFISEVVGLRWWFPIVPGLVISLAPTPRNRRRARRAGPGRFGLPVLVAVAVLASTGPVWSLGTNLSAPSTDALSVRVVEWLRTNGGRAQVNLVERWWYQHHPPKLGGTPTLPLAVGDSGPVGAANRTEVAQLTPVPSPAGVSLPGEGQWTVVAGSAARPAVAVTRVRPDAVHTSLLAAIARIDPGVARLQLQGGTEDPGPSWPSGGQVSQADRPRLLAAFNSGFRLNEAGGGYWDAGRSARPLVKGAAALVFRTDGSATVAQWGRDANLGPDVAAVRQNLELIVDQGAPVSGLNDANTNKWGKTLGHQVLVWRSGIGVTPDGALVWVGGPGLSINSLAGLLVAAHAVRAMELDINSAWVAFFLYGAKGGTASGTRLLPDMVHAPDRYLHPQSRDFVSVLVR